jgi:hypothetical protein
MMIQSRRRASYDDYSQPPSCSGIFFRIQRVLVKPNYALQNPSSHALAGQASLCLDRVSGEIIAIEMLRCSETAWRSPVMCPGIASLGGSETAEQEYSQPRLHVGCQMDRNAVMLGANERWAGF